MNAADEHAWILDDVEAEGRGLHALASELFPLLRSITGEGLRQTLRTLGDGLPFTLHEVPSGTPIFDWTVPDEWNCRRAWIKDPQGQVVVDTADSNLHIMGYSLPLHEKMPLSRLQEHLYSLPEHEDLIPWKTSYYRRDWGFSLTDRRRRELVEGEYEVFIDAELKPGSLSYGEVVLPGRRSEEILISSHACHPSLANDNLSGLVVTRRLAQILAERPRRWTYRFVWAPGTVGSIAFLAGHEEILPRVRGGLVVAGVGDPGPLSYKRSREGRAQIDRIVERVLRRREKKYRVFPFTPDGYDERQYNSPGIGLPVGRLSRTPWGSYPQYHTSGDDLQFITPESLASSLAVLLEVCGQWEQGVYYRNLRSKGEPQLGRRGLYAALGGHRGRDEREAAMLWLLNFSDGSHSLADIEDESGIDRSLLEEMAGILQEHELLSLED